LFDSFFILSAIISSTRPHPVQSHRCEDQKGVQAVRFLPVDCTGLAAGLAIWIFADEKKEPSFSLKLILDRICNFDFNTDMMGRLRTEQQ
jgi:hypothetical protein